MDDSKTAAESYLQTLLCKTLRITTTDSRMFLGTFKCTDSDLNIILTHTHEYRPPPPPSPSSLPASSSTDKTIPKTITYDITPRFLGLVVVPGEHIVRIEVEEFASQLKGKGVKPPPIAPVLEGKTESLAG